ncbi:DUF3299 domain-containing protein [Loktanella sp. R86503]|uniref:DUF3299 domain-containing protein n=1 Tax=Loktanella sp. R86503 TaxID=3093847 RepID=UPI0036DED1BC
MVVAAPTRRAMLLALSAFAVARPGHAETIVDLDWKDLLPEGNLAIPNEMQGLLPHDEADMASQQPRSTGSRPDWNGQTVRLSGFVVPLDYKGTGLTAFMLVPYVGACIHVPPPPANQLVFVTTEKPYQHGRMFDAVTITGMFGTVSIQTHLAEVGYALSADRIAPYEG